MDDEGVAIGIIALVLALAGLGLVLALPSGISGTGLLFTNGTRPLIANWDQGAYNLTNANSWFLGYTLWSQIQNKPATFTPSSHTHDASDVISGAFSASRIPTLTLSASNISSGTFGNNRLNLSALAQNIAFTSTQTVDGIDISAYINQAVLTSSTPSFSGLTSGGELLFNGYGNTRFNYGVFHDIYLTFGSTGRVYFRIYDGGSYVNDLMFLKADGSLTVSGTITGYYMSGDYGLTWTQSMPSGVNGMMVTVYNSNAGILSSRWYVYTNSGWHWSALT